MEGNSRDWDFDMDQPEVESPKKVVSSYKEVITKEILQVDISDSDESVDLLRIGQPKSFTVTESHVVEVFHVSDEDGEQVVSQICKPIAYAEGKNAPEYTLPSLESTVDTGEDFCSYPKESEDKCTAPGSKASNNTVESEDESSQSSGEWLCAKRVDQKDLSPATKKAIKKKRFRYVEHDDRRMIDYLIRTDRIAGATIASTWNELSNSGELMTFREPVSLANHFKNFLLKDYDYLTKDSGALRKFKLLKEKHEKKLYEKNQKKWAKRAWDRFK